MEFRVRHHDGTVRHVRSVARALLDGDSQVKGYVGAVEDITERLQAVLRIAS
jgi:PAS domain S-box-containing protein